MIALWIAAGLIGGLALGRALRPRRAGSSRRSRFAVKITGGSTAAPTLDEIVAALRAEAHRVDVQPDGVDVIDQLGDARAPRFALRVRDPQQVALDTLRCVDSPSLDLPFGVALALVPLYGPLALTLAGETYDIDGTRDRHDLVSELSRRQSAKVRHVMLAR